MNKYLATAEGIKFMERIEGESTRIDRQAVHFRGRVETQCSKNFMESVDMNFLPITLFLRGYIYVYMQYCITHFMGYRKHYTFNHAD